MVETDVKTSPCKTKIENPRKCVAAASSLLLVRARKWNLFRGHSSQSTCSEAFLLGYWSSST